MAPLIRRYHTGIFCPIIKANCRSDCAAMRFTEDYCKIIDGLDTLVDKLDSVLDILGAEP